MTNSNLILLTGATGFIGEAFLKQALHMGWRVRVLTRKLNNWPAEPGVEVVEGDLASTQDWSTVVAGVDVIVHAAAEINNVHLMSLINVLGSTQLLHAALNAGVKRWVQLSSVGAYGIIHDGMVSEDWCDNPLGPYEVSKSDFDKVLIKIAGTANIEICILRPSIVYGPGMRNQSILQMVNAIRNGIFAFIGVAGSSANYVHVNDVAQALILCVERPQAANQIYIVSAWATMEDMVAGLAAGAGRPLPKRRISSSLALCLASLFKWIPRWPLTKSRIAAMTTQSRYSTGKIERELGWKLSVPVKDGMQQLAREINQ